MPNAHPKPYESALWQHLDTIRLLRRGRKTWAAIATHLEQAHGLKTSFRAVHKFFKRASGARIPLGFNDTGSTTNTDGSVKPGAKPGVEAHDDPFSARPFRRNCLQKPREGTPGRTKHDEPSGTNHCADNRKTPVHRLHAKHGANWQINRG